jgi:hypothetical protein
LREQGERSEQAALLIRQVVDGSFEAVLDERLITGTPQQFYDPGDRLTRVSQLCDTPTQDNRQGIRKFYQPLKLIRAGLFNGRDLRLKSVFS